MRLVPLSNVRSPESAPSVILTALPKLSMQATSPGSWVVDYLVLTSRLTPTQGIHWFRRMTGNRSLWHSRFLMDYLKSIKPLGASVLSFHVVQSCKGRSANFCLIY